MQQLFILLDGAQGLIIIPLFLIFHIITTVFIEGSVLKYYGYGSFGRCAGHAVIANLLSLITGVLLIGPVMNFTYRMVKDDGPLFNFYVLIPFYLQTIIVEGFVLWALTHFPIKKLVPATLIMNLLTYITLWLILTYIQ